MPTFYAVATPGLEPVVAHELSSLGVCGTVLPGGVQFDGPLTLAWLACRLRTVARLRVSVVSGKAHTLEQLAALLRQGHWSTFLRPGDAVEVSVSSRQSRLRFKDAVARKVAHTIHGRTGRPRQRGGATQQVSVRLDNDLATVSIDAGGELLHRRGWRLASARAPLRENLAASLLWMAGFAGDEPLLDPFCGAGTIPIEAARMVAGLPPGQGRAYACQSWPGLIARPTRAARSAPPSQPIMGSDRDPGAVRAATENAARAHVKVSWRHLDLRELQRPASSGLVVTNPPYGVRVGNAGREGGNRGGGAYAALGIALRGPLRGWRALFLAPTSTFARKVDRKATRLTTFRNGGIEVGVWAAAAQA